MPVMAYCPYCGNVFRSRYFGSIKDSTGVELKDNQEPCTNCGLPANVQDGVYDAVGGVVRRISDANLSRENLAALTALIQQARKGDISKEKLAEESALIDPKVGSEIKRALAAGPITVILILLLTVLNKCSVSSTLDWNKLYDQFFGQTEQVELVSKKDDGSLQDASQGKKGAHTNPTGDGTSEEKPDVPTATHKKPPNKKSKHQKRRTELRARREAFNPRKK